MPSLPADAVDHLWPVLAIFGLLVFLVSTLVVGLWRGFKWLGEQIEEKAGKMAKSMLAPVVEDVRVLKEEVAHLKRSARRAHFRITRTRTEAGLPQDIRDEYDTGVDA